MERRFKHLRIDPGFVINTLNGLGFSLPVSAEVPEGAQVISMMADQFTDSIVLKVYHPSFPIVPVGDAIEALPISLLERAQMLRWNYAAPREAGEYLIQTSSGRYVVAKYFKTEYDQLFRWEFPSEPTELDDETMVKWTKIEA